MPPSWGLDSFRRLHFFPCPRCEVNGPSPAPEPQGVGWGQGRGVSRTEWGAVVWKSAAGSGNRAKLKCQSLGGLALAVFRRCGDAAGPQGAPPNHSSGSATSVR